MQPAGVCLLNPDDGSIKLKYIVFFPGRYSRVQSQQLGRARAQRAQPVREATLTGEELHVYMPVRQKNLVEHACTVVLEKSTGCTILYLGGSELESFAPATRRGGIRARAIVYTRIRFYH